MPIILAQLIQALYNIVDNYFVSKYFGTGRTVPSIIYPVQLLISTLGIGPGVGMNIMMAKYYGENKKNEAQKIAGTGILLVFFNRLLFIPPKTSFILEHYI